MIAREALPQPPHVFPQQLTTEAPSVSDTSDEQAQINTMRMLEEKAWALFHQLPSTTPIWAETLSMLQTLNQSMSKEAVSSNIRALNVGLSIMEGKMPSHEQAETAYDADLALQTLPAFACEYHLSSWGCVVITLETKSSEDVKTIYDDALPLLKMATPHDGKWGERLKDNKFMLFYWEDALYQIFVSCLTEDQKKGEANAYLAKGTNGEDIWKKALTSFAHVFMIPELLTLPLSKLLQNNQVVRIDASVSSPWKMTSSEKCLTAIKQNNSFLYQQCDNLLNRSLQASYKLPQEMVEFAQSGDIFFIPSDNDAPLKRPDAPWEDAIEKLMAELKQHLTEVPSLTVYNLLNAAYTQALLLFIPRWKLNEDETDTDTNHLSSLEMSGDFRDEWFDPLPYFLTLYNSMRYTKQFMMKRDLSSQPQWSPCVTPNSLFMDDGYSLLLLAIRRDVSDYPGHQPFLESIKAKQFSHALHLACSEGYLDLVKLLIHYLTNHMPHQFPAYLNAHSQDGRTALHWAAIAADGDADNSLLDLLRRHGANEEILDGEGKLYTDYLSNKQNPKHTKWRRISKSGDD